MKQFGASTFEYRSAVVAPDVEARGTATPLSSCAACATTHPTLHMPTRNRPWWWRLTAPSTVAPKKPPYDYDLDPPATEPWSPTACFGFVSCLVARP
jgi:hypothetical protein